jgi:hypothetical protein
MDRLGIRHLGSRLPISLREALFLFILLRLALSMYAFAATFLFQVPPPCFHNGVVDWTSMPVLYTDGLDGRLFGVWERWDACWYLRIAEYGYEVGEPGTAFFPVYPLAIRILAPFFLGNVVLAALAVSAIGYIAAMAILHAMVSVDLDRGTAERAMLYLSVFPTAFFLFAPFTESIFLALALAALYCMRTKRYGYAVVAALLVGLTRPQGVLLGLPLAWETLLVLRDHRLAPGHRLATITAGAATVAPAIGFGLFVAYAELATGVSPFDAERQHWGYGNAPPWEVLGQAWRWMLDPANAGFADIQAMTGFHLVLIALFVALFVVGLRKVPATYSLYVLPQLLVVMLGGPATPLQSASRFMLGMFPIFVVLGHFGSRRWFHTSWLTASLLGLGLLFLAILLNVPVG